MKKCTSDEVRDLTGFELYLESKGYEMVPADNYYLNSYDCCGRVWQKPTGEKIVIWLMDHPCRIGITTPWIDLPTSFLPSEDQYESRLQQFEQVSKLQYT
jgi:hypothetical protein